MKTAPRGFEEQITFVFSGEYHGIYRDIPVDYPGPSGINYTLFIKVDAITDESGSKLKFEKKTSDGFLKLKVYVPGATTPPAPSTSNTPWPTARASLKTTTSSTGT